MIGQNEILTATAVVEEKLPLNTDLSNIVGSLIKGLTMSTVSLDGLTEENLVTELPVITGEGSEHTELLKASVEKISAAIRQSLSVISTHVIPACDIIEKHIKEVSSEDTITDNIVYSIDLNFTSFQKELFNSNFLPTELSDDYLKGVLFDPNAFNKIGDFPRLKPNEIRALISEVSVLPELKEIIESDSTLTFAWDLIKYPNLSKHKDVNGFVNLKDVIIEPYLFKEYLVALLIFTKLDGMEDPLEGVTGVELETYRENITKLKRFFKCIVYLNVKNLKVIESQGIVIFKENIKYNICDNKKDIFYGSKVLTGNVSVGYSEEIGEFVSNSSDYSLSEVVIGMLYAKATGKQFIPTTIIQDIPKYQEFYKEYLNELTTKALLNIKILVNSNIEKAFDEIAQMEVWDTFISKEFENASNKGYKLEQLLDKVGGYKELLVNPKTVKDVCSGNLRIANTVMASRFAEVIGAPIASEILLENINSDCSCPLKQQKVLAKAITKAVVKRLLA